MKAYEQGYGWGGTIASTSFDNLYEAFEAVEYFGDNTDIYSQLDFLYGWQRGTPIITPFLTYSKESPGVPDCFKNFTNLIRERDNTRNAPLSDLVQDMYSADGRRQSISSVTLVNNIEMYWEYYLLSNATIQPLLAEIPELSFFISLQPLPQELSQKRNGDNFLGLDPEDGHLTIINNFMSWDDPAQDEIILTTLKRLNEQLIARMKELGYYNSYIFQNTAEYWQNPYPGRGVENLAALKAISKKYDPEQLFQKAVPGGYKL